MMAVDTSALIAILEGEPEADAFLHALEDAESICLSAVSLLEATMVARQRKGYDGESDLAELLQIIGATIIPFDEAMARLAIHGFKQYVRGSQSRAKLNFGDCAAYALAKSLGAPLLYKGGDFSETDIVSAI